MPYQILFGRDVSQPLDTIFGCPENYMKEGKHAASDATTYTADLKQRLLRANTYVRRNLGEAVRRQRRNYHHQKKSFLPGTKVWLFTPTTTPGIATKLFTYWSGLWTVSVSYTHLTLPTNREV